MNKILYIAHTESDGSLCKNALEAVQAAINLKNELNAQLAIGIIGETIQHAADSISGCGAEVFLGVSGKDFKDPRYATDTAALESIIKQSGADLIMAPATSRFSKSLPGAVFRTGGAIDTHVSGIKTENGGISIKRWYYRQRMEATIKRNSKPWALLIDGGLYEVYTGDTGTIAIEEVPVNISNEEKKTKVVGMETPSQDEQTIRPDARLLFVAGAGWTKKQSDGKTHLDTAEKHILSFLEKTKASLGSSKSLVDQNAEDGAVLGFMSHLNQIGQTGATPRHQKGLATCCHGEEPHVVGWRFINERRAVNLDANCGWAQGKADVLYVADSFEVMEKINELL